MTLMLLVLYGCFIIYALTLVEVYFSRRKPKRKTAMQELQEVAGIMAGSRAEWVKIHHDAMEDWERRFDPVAYRQRGNARLDSISGRPIHTTYMPPPRAKNRSLDRSRGFQDYLSDYAKPSPTGGYTMSEHDKVKDRYVASMNKYGR